MYIECDRCYCDADVEGYSTEEAQEFLEYDGWYYDSSRGYYLCPDCRGKPPRSPLFGSYTKWDSWWANSCQQCKWSGYVDDECGIIESKCNYQKKLFDDILPDTLMKTFLFNDGRTIRCSEREK